MKIWITSVLLPVCLLAGCRSRPVDEGARAESSPEVASTAEVAPYQPSETRYFDLIHTDLKVDFDWELEQMHGVARLKMRPYFHPATKVVLDAKGFVIQKVARVQDGNEIVLRHTYDQMNLEVTLDRTFSRNDEFELSIEYISRPASLDTLVPVEAADEPGLYFINPRGEREGVPRQIWTQGESRGASGWFPTFDQPNERCTQEMHIRVADTFLTLSNGLLVGSTRHDDGTRTDHWKMSMPHAPYLFMMAVGKFHKEVDQWRGKEVSYYVEPQFAPYAKLIFGNTPEMMEFFSQKLGVDYPWEKYAQIVVRDFVSGAMENTSATVHFDGLQHDAREHVDETREDYISHELFHQWFGDLVTCESWANLTLNEGFATYGEYLWKDYKYGHDEAEYHLQGDLESYLGEAMNEKKPLIRFHHEQPGDMFDSHSYQKGGRVLHMLRYYLGDPAFFQGLKLYLTKNAFTDVEVDELRMAFEEVSGEDLKWFFDQWFMKPGHPELDISHSVEEGKWLVHVVQTQEASDPVYRFPVRFELQGGQYPDLKEHWIQTRDTTFSFEMGEGMKNVVFDADNVLLADRRAEFKPREAWLHQVLQGSAYGQRDGALTAIEGQGVSEADLDVMLQALRDPFWGIRARVVEMLASAPEDVVLKSVPAVQAAMDDPNPKVRKEAIMFFRQEAFIEDGKWTGNDVAPINAKLKQLVNDTSNNVRRIALRLLHFVEPAAAVEFVERRLGTATPLLAPVFADILVKENLGSSMGLVERFIGPEQDFATRGDMADALELALESKELRPKAMALLKRMASDDPTWWIRYAAFSAMTSALGNDPEVREFLLERSKVEKVPYLLNWIESVLEN